MRTIVTVHYQTVRRPSERSISAAALGQHADAIRAGLTAAAGVLAAEVDATALPGGASVYVDVTMAGTPLEALAPALEAILGTVARAERAPELPRLEGSTVASIRAERA